MNQAKFSRMYQRIVNGDFQNINYSDLCDFVVDLGFFFVRQKGTSHKVYSMQGHNFLIVLQEGKKRMREAVSGQAGQDRNKVFKNRRKSKCTMSISIK